VRGVYILKILEVKKFTVFAYRTNYVFVKIFTDSGITGIGEGTLEYKENALLGALEDAIHVIIGQNPMEIERIVNDLYRESYWRTGPVLMSAISAIEMALWDIKGKFYKASIYDLIGGKVRSTIRMYANGWFSGAKEPEQFATAAKKAVSLGISALKWDPFGSAYMSMTRKEFFHAIAIVEAVRAAVGNDVDLLIEGHGRFNVSTSCRIANALKPFDPFFFEEPTPPDSLDAIAEVRSKSPIPIAAGERIYGIHQFQEFLDKGCADYVQPDVSHCGGIMAIKKMAAMAETHYISVAPHNPSGPVANAATLQLAGNISNFCILEIMLTDVTWRKELTTEKVVFDNGDIVIPDKPGLGLDLDEIACSSHPFQPIDLRHYKGTLTNIRPSGSTSFYFDGLPVQGKEIDTL